MTAGAGLTGVIGWPVAHSISPRLHRYWLDQCGLDGHYVPLAVRPDHLAQALAVLPNLGFRGVNITVPHKEAVARLVKRLDPAARRAGAVNTVIFDDKGGRSGFNTDAAGFVAALGAGKSGVDPAGARVLVLGAGGASRAIVTGLLDAGVSAICVVNRTPRRAARMLEEFDDPRLSSGAWNERTHRLKDCDLLVNTTVLGMTGEPPLDLDLSLLPRRAVVADIVYRPLQTGLLARADRRGLQTVDGLGMLIHQGGLAFDMFFGVKPAIDAAVRAELETELRERTA